jgi:hypothetical protein
MGRARNLAALLFLFISRTVFSSNAVSDMHLSGGMTIRSMEKVFARSESARQASMATITRTLTVPKAVEVLRRHHHLSPAMLQVTNMALGKRHLRQPKGYAGIEGARKLLNDMIYESMSKYDAEIARCTDFYATQCAAMEACRGQIAASNYIAANSRALILDAQANINTCEVHIPTRKLELSQHLLKCKHELHKMNARLKIILGDIAVMTMILKMTDCEKKLLQTDKLALLRCQDPCTKTSFISFSHDDLKNKVSQLQSGVAHNLMHETFADLFSGVESLETMEQEPVINKTKFANPPLPRTQVPGNPCNDPDAGAPSAADKRAAKCTIGKSPQCYKLQERFLLIQAGIQDERDELMEEIAAMEVFCKETKETLETQIQNDESLLAESQTKLAAATEKEANAGEVARQTAKENEELSGELAKQMKTCSGNYINFETELCALKKIRGELYKMKGSGHSAFFQDCEVSKWDPEECSKKCAGGEQKLARSILTHPNGGAKCLPLAALRSCNNKPCPVDCRMDAWSGWSKCSADCGGGVEQRLREVKLAMKYGGEPCGETSETRACNNQACEKDCELSGWTKWSACSKDCDGGTRKRQKFVKDGAKGDGKCPGEWSTKRLQYESCNMKRCKVDPGKPLACDKKLDVVLMLDGSGSMGKKGFKGEIKTAKLFVSAFMASGKANMAVIRYSGPRTWSGVDRCTGKTEAKVSPEECGIKTVTHLTDDLKKVQEQLTNLEWTKGSTLTSLGLMAAKAELALGRKTAPAVVVVLTDGRPMSFRKTYIAARALRKAARLLWVPVTKHAPLKFIKKLATRRWQENVVPVPGFAELEKPDVVTHIIADICPSDQPKIVNERAPLN